MCRYLRRFARQAIDGNCKCGLGIEDMRHIKEVCTLHDLARREVNELYGNIDIH